MPTEPSQISKCVIPAAGLGTRLRPATKSQPKEMLPVGRKPAIQHVVEEAIGAGCRSFLLITGRAKRAIEDHFDLDPLSHRALEGELDYEALGVRFFFVRQAQQTGLADALSLAEEFAAGEPVAVCLGDAVIEEPEPGGLLKRCLAAHRETGAAATIACREVPAADVSRYGIMKPLHEAADRFRIGDMIEKPSPAEAPSRLAVTARYIFDAVVFDALREVKANPPGKGNEYQLTDALRFLLRDGAPLWGVQLAPEEKRHDVGNFASYFKAFLEFSLRDPECGAELREHARKLLGTEAGATNA